MTALRRRMIEDMRLRNRSRHTIDMYVLAAKQFANHFGRSPEQLTGEQVRQYLLHLVEGERAGRGRYNVVRCHVRGGKGNKDRMVKLSAQLLAAAIAYTLNQWDARCRYTDEGFLNIDNNAAERAVKRVVIGRKNWLFAGHDAAGASHAKLWTLIASAERHGVDPQRYLTSVLAKVGQAKLRVGPVPAGRVDEGGRRRT